MTQSSDLYITVLMPVYNAEKYVREAIESVLAQTHNNYELLIIDDGSTDNSKDVISSFKDSRIRFIENEDNTGMAPTLNRGLRLARYDLVARQDADDICHPDRLAIQARYMAENKDVALLGSRGWEIDEHGRKLRASILQKPLDHISVKWFLQFDNPFIHTSVMFRNNIIKDIYSGYKLSDWCADYDLWSRVALRYKTANIDRKLVYYRVHSNSIIGSLPENIRSGSIPSDESINVMMMNIEATIGHNIHSGQEARILRGIVDGIDGSSIQYFLETYQSLLNEFKRKYPEYKRSKDFKQTVASQYATVAYQLLSYNRALAIRLFIRAIQTYPPIVIRLPWLRIIALVTLGGMARIIYRRFSKVK